MPKTKQSLEVEVKKILCKIIEVTPEQILPETNFIEDLGADSMMALEIMAALEKRFKVEISEQDLPKLANLTQILELLEGLLSNG